MPTLSEIDLKLEEHELNIKDRKIKIEQLLCHYERTLNYNKQAEWSEPLKLVGGIFGKEKIEDSLLERQKKISEKEIMFRIKTYQGKINLLIEQNLIIQDIRRYVSDLINKKGEYHSMKMKTYKKFKQVMETRITKYF